MYLGFTLSDWTKSKAIRNSPSVVMETLQWPGLATSVKAAAALREQVPVQHGGGDAQHQRRQPRAPRAATNERTYSNNIVHIYHTTFMRNVQSHLK